MLRSFRFDRHNVYKTKLPGIDSKIAFEFDAIGSDKICTNIPKFKSEKVYKFLKSKDIEISYYLKDY